MILAGVDPGVTGALALIDSQGPRFLSSLDMPVLRFGTKARMTVDQRAIGDWLAEAQHEHGVTIDAFVVEHQQPFPGNSAAINNVLGIMFGSILAPLAAMGLPVHFATPAVWKRKCDLLGKPKERALDKARQTFGLHPDLTIKRLVTNQVQAIARSDAALLAYFGLPERATGKRAPTLADVPLLRGAVA